MTRIATLAAAALVAATSLAAPAAAQQSGAREQIIDLVEFRVKRYVPGADVRGLSTPGLLAVYSILNSSAFGESDKRRQLRAALNDRTLFFPRGGGIALGG